MAVPQAAVLPRLHRGSRTEKAAETSCELLAGVSGHRLRWETASDQRRPILHLVFAGAALRPTSYTGMGTVADFAVAIAKAGSDSSWIAGRRLKVLGPSVEE